MWYRQALDDLVIILHIDEDCVTSVFVNTYIPVSESNVEQLLDDKAAYSHPYEIKDSLLSMDVPNDGIRKYFFDIKLSDGILELNLHDDDIPWVYDGIHNYVTDKTYDLNKRDASILQNEAYFDGVWVSLFDFDGNKYRYKAIVFNEPYAGIYTFNITMDLSNGSFSPDTGVFGHLESTYIRQDVIDSYITQNRHFFFITDKGIYHPGDHESELSHGGFYFKTLEGNHQDLNGVWLNGAERSREDLTMSLSFSNYDNNLLIHSVLKLPADEACDFSNLMEYYDRSDKSYRYSITRHEYSVITYERVCLIPLFISDDVCFMGIAEGLDKEISYYHLHYKVK
ncbi:MAG: hypothetical protein FWG21_00670 [Oscillospiraceae bacterium]|nr:hypothetical protein [Oscillospiraceae bacterium]